MESRGWFWSIIVVYSAAALFAGFWLVPNWAENIQTDQQRYQYLIESIWCPI